MTNYRVIALRYLGQRFDVKRKRALDAFLLASRVVKIYKILPLDRKCTLGMLRNAGGKSNYQDTYRLVVREIDVATGAITIYDIIEGNARWLVKYFNERREDWKDFNSGLFGYTFEISVEAVNL